MSRLRRLFAPALRRCAERPDDEGAGRRARSEDGFTIIELMVASGIMLVGITAMLFTTFAGLRGITVARQRQVANGFANQALEQIRALPLATVERGLSNSDLASSDPRISVTGSGSSAVYRYGGERIPHGDNVTAAPLVPHRQTFVRNNITYTVGAYITHFEDNLTSGKYRATVIVSWTGRGGTGTSSQVQAQTILYSPTGCTSTATHPFSAPCQAFLYGSASNAAGSVTVKGFIQSLSFDYATLWLPGQSSGTQVEQVQAVQGTAQTSGISLKLTGQTEQTSGRQSVTTGSDDDRSQTKPDYQSATAPVQTGGVLTSTVNNNFISVAHGADDVASTVSTIAANSASRICPLLVPVSSFDVSQNDGAPCGNSKALQGGTLAASMNLRAGPTDLTTTLFSLASQSNPSGAFTNRAITPQGSVCPSAAGDGCIQSLQYRNRGAVTLINLPPVLPATDLPPGYDTSKGLIQLTGFADSVNAEAGVGSASPSVSLSGTVSYYNGSGYSTISLAPGNPVSIPLGSGGGGVHIHKPDLNGAPLDIDVEANLTTGGTATTDSGTTTCTSGLCRTSASATSRSPITGTITYQVTYANDLVCDLTVTIDLGNLLARSSYTAAPSGA